MNDKDKLIASFRQQLREALSKISALEQEIALLQCECRKKSERIEGKENANYSE